MTIFKLALLQLTPENTISANLQKGLEACKQAKQLGADLALFPELWQLGYDRNKMLKENAIDLEDNFITEFKSLAAQLQMAIVPSFLGMGNQKPTNNLVVIDYKGNIVINYAKVHICKFKGGTELGLEAGDRFYTKNLQFASGDVNIGSMICMDREFPESARTLMMQGAELLLVPNSCELHECPVFGNARIAGMQACAYENMVGVAVTNYAFPKHDGHSCAFDATGEQLHICGTEEEIHIVNFDIAAIRKHRTIEAEVRGKAARKTTAYELD